MAQRTKKFLSLSSIIATVGTWALAIASNIATFNKSAADDTSVLYIPIHEGLDPESPDARERTVSLIEVPYSVATAALDAAPSAVLSKVTISETTGVRTRSTLTQTLAFIGTDTGGLNVGTFIAQVTPATPVRCENNEELWLELTINAAATSVVKLFPPRIKY